VTAPSGLGTMAAMLVVGRLTGKVDFRLLLGVGFAITAFSLWQMTHYTLVLSQSDIVWPGVIQGVGLGLVFVPLSAATFATLSPQMRAEGTALYSLVRNIGSSIGIALVQALLVRNTQIAHASLAMQVTARIRPCATPRASTTWPRQAGPALINNEVTRQASMIAYVDDYWLMMLLTVAVIPMLLLIRPPKASAAPAQVDHALSIKPKDHQVRHFKFLKSIAAAALALLSGCISVPPDTDKAQGPDLAQRPARTGDRAAGRRLARRTVVARLPRPAAERPRGPRPARQPELGASQARVAERPRGVTAPNVANEGGRVGLASGLNRQRYSSNGFFPPPIGGNVVQRRQRAAARILRRRLVGQAPRAGRRRAGRDECERRRSRAGRQMLAASACKAICACRCCGRARTIRTPSSLFNATSSPAARPAWRMAWSAPMRCRAPELDLGGPAGTGGPP
jgi:hypothetical protein